MHTKLLETDENLQHAELSPGQRAASIARRKELWEALHPTEGDRISVTLGGKQKVEFATDTQRATGEDRRRTNEHLARASALGPDLHAVIGTSLDKGVELPALDNGSLAGRPDRAILKRKWVCRLKARTCAGRKQSINRSICHAGIARSTRSIVFEHGVEDLRAGALLSPGSDLFGAIIVGHARPLKAWRRGRNTFWILARLIKLVRLAYIGASIGRERESLPRRAFGRWVLLLAFAIEHP